jgi:hypothetical protein
MNIQIKLVYELNVDDWYEDEKLSKKAKLQRLQEDLSDISVHCKHCNYDTLVDCEVKEID